MTGSPIRERAGLGYPLQYLRLGGAGGDAPGFRTTAGTRPMILAGLVEISREHPDWLWDRETIAEMLSFVRGSQGRAQAQFGAHDDCVMALAIAYHAREQLGWRQGDWGWLVDR